MLLAFPCLALASPQNLPPVEDVPQDRNLPARTVYIELNKVHEAFGYDVDIRAYDQKWPEPFTFHLDNEILRVRLTPGHYLVRTRSFDEQHQPGSWGEMKDFWVPFKAPTSMYPGPNAQIIPKAVNGEKITFEWPAIENANGYLVKVKNSKGKVIHTYKTTQPWLSTEVMPGASYSWALAPLLDPSVTEVNEDELTYNKFSVAIASPYTRGMYFEVSGNPTSQTYQYELIHLGEEGESTPSSFDTKDPGLRVRLSPGHYELRARSFDDQNISSDWSPPSDFFIEMLPVQIVGPSLNDLIDADDDTGATIPLKWKKQPGAVKYKVFVYDDQGDLYTTKEVFSETADVHVPHDKSYNWTVEAYSAGEQTREVVKFDPLRFNRFTVSRFEKVDLDLAEEPASMYGWGRYIISDITYIGQNYDNNTLTRQVLFAGSGELAAGNWFQHSKFGLLGQMAMSGFSTAEQTFTYVNGAINLGWRHIFPNGGRARIWLGAGYHELPELIGNPYTQLYAYTKIVSAGPQIQLSYFNKISETLGYHAYLLGLYGMVDLGTPTGTPQIPQLSIQAGFAGTLKLSDRYTGMMGYSYKSERAAYQSADSSGNPNKIDFSGHYLNLILEFALSKPHP